MFRSTLLALLVLSFAAPAAAKLTRHSSNSIAERVRDSNELRALLASAPKGRSRKLVGVAAEGQHPNFRVIVRFVERTRSGRRVATCRVTGDAVASPTRSRPPARYFYTAVHISLGEAVCTRR